MRWRGRFYGRLAVTGDGIYVFFQVKKQRTEGETAAN
jgi:hypothetical protein